jgi:hypothetical protein
LCEWIHDYPRFSFGLTKLWLQLIIFPMNHHRYVLFTILPLVSITLYYHGISGNSGNTGKLTQVTWRMW